MSLFNPSEQIRALEENKSLILTKAKMLKLVESRVTENRYTSIEAVIDICTEYGLEPDTIIHLIHPSLKEKIRCEAIEARMIKDSHSSQAIM